MCTSEFVSCARVSPYPAEGIPMLALFQELNLFQQGRKPAAVVGEPKTGGGEEYITRIDPEIDEIRNGNVDSGIKASDINGLKASLPDFYQIKFMEDNQATITVCQSGSSASMRRANKTQKRRSLAAVKRQAQ